MKANYSTSSIPKSIPIFVKDGSIEQRLLDPQYYRIIGGAPAKSSLRTAIPSIDIPREQVAEPFITKEKSSAIIPQIVAIALDDITIFSGPTSYMDGSNKRYEITFKINNPQKLKIKDVEYRIAEAS